MTSTRLIEKGDLVTLKGKVHTVLKLNDKKPSALLSWGENDVCWWPIKELKLYNSSNQLDLCLEDKVERADRLLKEYSANCAAMYGW